MQLGGVNSYRRHEVDIPLVSRANAVEVRAINNSQHVSIDRNRKKLLEFS